MTSFVYAIRTVPQRRQMFEDLLTRLQDTTCDGLIVACGISASGHADVSPNENACQAIEGALQFNADWIMFLEDDAGPIVDLIGSTSRWLADHARDDIHLYPLGCQYSLPADAAYWEYPISCFYCSVAMVIRASMAPSLVAYLRANSHVRQGLDLMMGHWHRTVSPSDVLLTPAPYCFVDHLGDESTLIDGRPDRNVVGRFRCYKDDALTY